MRTRTAQGRRSVWFRVVEPGTAILSMLASNDRVFFLIVLIFTTVHFICQKIFPKVAATGFFAPGLQTQEYLAVPVPAGSGSGLSSGIMSNLLSILILSLASAALAFPLSYLVVSTNCPAASNLLNTRSYPIQPCPIPECT